MSIVAKQLDGWTRHFTEVNLGLGHIVLDWDPAPPLKGAQQPPLFLAHVYCGHGRPSQLLLSCRLWLFSGVVFLCPGWMFAFVVLGLVSSVLAKKLAGKNVSEMIYVVSSGT